MKRITSLILGVLISTMGLSTSVYAETKQPIAENNVTLNSISPRTAYDWTNSYTLEPFRSHIITGPLDGGRFRLRNAYGGYDNYVKVSVNKTMDFRVRIEVDNGTTYYKTVYGGKSTVITLPAIDSHYRVYVENYTPNTANVDVTVTARSYPL